MGETELHVLEDTEQSRSSSGGARNWNVPATATALPGGWRPATMSIFTWRSSCSSAVAPLS